MSEFRCLGGECPDTCCADWTISIDKGTFGRYRREVNPALKPLLRKHLTQDNKESYSLHGTLQLREEDRHCPMHTGSGLCAIQQHLGQAALSNTCFIFPRVFFSFGERTEQHLTLSCPEAARLALTTEDPFRFVTTDVTTRPAVVGQLRSSATFSLDAMDQVRTFAVQLFQTPALSNIERLAALGWLSSQIDVMRAASSAQTANGLISDMTAMVETGALTKTVAALSEQSSIGITVFYILFKNPAASKRPPQHQVVMDQVSVGLGLDGSRPLDLNELESKYRLGLSLLRQPSSIYEQIVSRYLLNEILREIFPWGETSAMLHFRKLLTRFGILRMMLAGVASCKGSSLDSATMVTVVQVFCRLYQHNSTFSEEAEKCLKDLEWNSLERLYTLLN